MKTYFITIVAVVIGLSSCNQKNISNDAGINGNAYTLHVKADFDGHSDFNLDQVRVSQQEVGDFPYLSVPSGYRHGDNKEKSLEEKYFFYNDSLVRKVRGEYFYTAVFQQGDVFEDTYVVNEYKKAIEKSGDVEFYSGGLPASASELIDKEKPAYGSEMYDPSPYQ
jgi:hypothetical protein